MTFLQKHHGQMSDSMLTAFFIILSGGLQDAYTYCCRGKVFANAQTGNIVLLSTHLFEGDWGQALRYLVPVLAFLLGIYIAECVHRHFKRMEKVHWRQLIILAEIVLLAAVGFLPETLNTTANAVVSFVCAMQVQTFRKVRGHAYASTMCIGNMRSGTEALCAYFHTGDKENTPPGADVFRRGAAVRAGRGRRQHSHAPLGRGDDLAVLRAADHQFSHHVHPRRGTEAERIKTTPAALPTRCRCCFEVVFLMEKKSKSMVG